MTLPFVEKRCDSVQHPEKTCLRRKHEMFSLRNVILRGIPTERIKAIDEIARITGEKLAGEKPTHWQKPAFGDFEYWLAYHCDWICDKELKADTDAYNAKRQLAREAEGHGNVHRPD